MDVILINSPLVLYKDPQDRKENYISDGDEWSYYPLNLLYLASYLISKGHTVKIIDPNPQKLNSRDIQNIIYEEKPKLIGITAMTPSIQSALKLAKSIKYNFKTPLVLGGVHITNDKMFTDRFPRIFDYAIWGDGEVALLKLLKLYKETNYSGVSTPKLHTLREMEEQIEDLDSLPFPARHLIDSKLYNKTAGILSSRGCPYNCSFCSIPSSGHKVRFRSAKNVVDEMEEIYDTCGGAYSFVDDCFTVARTHVFSICQRLIDRRIKCTFIASTRPNLVDEEMIKLLKRAGCTDLYFGVESGSERIRNQVIGKNLSNKSVGTAVRLCERNGLTSNLFLMLGFPTETREDMLATRRIALTTMADHIGLHQTMPLPSSRVYQSALNEGKIPKNLVDQWANGDLGRNFKKAWVFYVPDGFTQKDMVNMKRYIYLSFYFNPRWILRRMLKWIRFPKLLWGDLKMIKVLVQVIRYGGTRNQLS
jgi:anaerobic magnesium-protoporphyrin IX monomethyl ester cyclase